MRAIALVKKVPDTGIPLKVLPDGSDIDRSSLQYVMSPYDEYALEAALRLKDAGKLSELIALTVGDEGAEDVLRTALAKGADRAVRIQVDDPEALDGLRTAELIAAWMKDQEVQVVFAGKEAVDDAAAQVQFYLSEFLGWPAVSYAVDCDLEGDTLKLERETDRGEETVALPLPAIIAFDRARFEPRLPSLRGIMQAKRKPIDRVEPDGEVQGAVQKVRFSLPPEREAGTVTTSEFPKNVEELIAFLKEKKLI